MDQNFLRADPQSCVTNNGFPTPLERGVRQEFLLSGILLAAGEALWIGSNKNRTDTPFGIRWSKDYVNALGIYFTTDQKTSYSKSLESRLLSLEKCLNVWSSRDLTLYGKINIVRILALSKLTFIASVLPIPDDFIKSVNKQIVYFIWSQNNPEITKTATIGEKRRGGGVSNA